MNIEKLKQFADLRFHAIDRHYKSDNKYSIFINAQKINDGVVYNFEELEVLQKELSQYEITVKCCYSSIFKNANIAVTKGCVYTILSVQHLGNFLYLIVDDKGEMRRYSHEFFDEPIFTKIEK